MTEGFAENYVHLAKIGEGTYGVVYQARDRRTSQIVAVKKLRLGEECDAVEGIPATSIREISLLRELQHDNVVKLLDIIIDYKPKHEKIYLVFEFVDRDLQKYLKDMQKNHTPISATMTKKLTYQLFLGLTYCHCRRILHRDLKPANLLITATNDLKIADFGLARAIGVPIRVYTHQIITLWYRPPEVLLGTPRYSTAVDVWSAGTILAEMARGGIPLFPGDSEIDEIFQIFRVLGTPDEEKWPDLREHRDFKPTFPKWAPQPLSTVVPALEPEGVDLLASILQYQSSKRMSAKRALQHPYFSNVDFKAMR